jgi:hypothetical protein
MEIYVSTDVETDGPAPGQNSMLSFASAAYRSDKTLIDTFSGNLEVLEGATSNPQTMAWWQTQQKAWKACRRDPQPPELLMPRYVGWLKSLRAQPVFVGYPAAFDFMFITYYLYKFAGENPFSYSALDIKTYAMAVLRIDFNDVHKRTMPKEWFDDLPFTHLPLDDAISQGAMFCNMLKLNKPGFSPSK